jgi:predicted GIY-YIG superfamily endonuclease
MVQPGLTMSSDSIRRRLKIFRNIARHDGCPRDRMALPKRFVYILRSGRDTGRYYTGVTSNMRARLAAHNAGECTHTIDGRPWELDVLIAFREQSRALAFERYLKSGSGVAFAKRRLRSTRATPAAPMATRFQVDLTSPRPDHAVQWLPCGTSGGSDTPSNRAHRP